jgi:hypothetical protein
VYVSGKRIGYVSKQTVAANRKAILATISELGFLAIPVVILGGRETKQVVLQPSSLAVADALAQQGKRRRGWFGFGVEPLVFYRK